MKADPASRLTWLTVSGAPRSGTTCLQQVLNTHPHVMCTHEFGPFRLAQTVYDLLAVDAPQTELLKLLAEKHAPSGDASQTVSPLKAFYEARDARVAAAVGDPFLIPRAPDFDAIARAIAGTVGRKTDVAVIADKTPNTHLHPTAPVVERCALRAKTLYVVRNPMDVVNSSIGRRNNARLGRDVWHLDTVEQAVAEWLGAWRHAASRVDDPDFLAVRYEDLLENFDETAGRIAAFIGVAPRFENILHGLPEGQALYALSPEERELAERHLGEISRLWPHTELSALLRADLKLFTPIPATGATFDGTSASDLFLQEGFCAPEPVGRWTLGRRAVVRLKTEPAEKVWVDFTLAPYLGNRPAVEFAFQAGGTLVHHRIAAGDPMPTRRGLATSAPDGRVEVEIVIPEPKRHDEPPETDLRPIGLFLLALRAWTI